jgi:vacuolar-type H+-ATPase subunit H
MRDVIEKIIATESEARLIVETARTEADQILSEAQKKGHDVIEKTRQKVLIEVGEIAEAAIETAEQEKQQRLASAAAEIERQIRLEPAGKESAVEGIVRCVCKQS